MFKQAGFEAVEVAYLQQPADIAKVDLFAFSPGTDPDGSSSHFPDWWEADKMEAVHLADTRPQSKLFGIHMRDVRLFGIDIFVQGASWEPDVYRFKKISPTP